MKVLSSSSSQILTASLRFQRVLWRASARRYSDVACQLGQLSAVTRRRAPDLKTLTPERLSPSDWVNPSGLTKLRAGFWNGDKFLQVHDMYYTKSRIAKPYPPDAAGFLYFKHPEPVANEPLSPAAGGLRFRIVDSPDPGRFSAGHDLRLPSGAFWSIHSLALRSVIKYRPVYDMMLWEGIITQQQEQEIQGLLPGVPPFRSGSIILDSVLQPFVFDFSHQGFSASVFSPEGYCYAQYRDVTLSSHMIGKVNSPYSGTGLVRFELIPPPLGKTTPKLVLRLLRYLNPPARSASLVQCEGELVKTYVSDDVDSERPWMADPYVSKRGRLLPSLVRTLEQQYL